MTSRRVEPEILDSLPHDHPDALASRGDIQLLNTIMGSFRWIRRMLQTHSLPGEGIAELGAGDASLMCAAGAPNPELASRWTGLDLAPAPAALPAGARWVQGDFFADGAAAEALAGSQIMVANLILHHFHDDRLRELGRRIRHARVLVISEPARHHAPLWMGRLLHAIVKFNPVTMYDMACSIRAGFRTGELPALLGLSEAEWELHEHTTPLGACRLLAVRRSGSCT